MPIQSVSVCNLKIESRLTNLDLFHNRAKDLTDPIPIITEWGILAQQTVTLKAVVSQYSEHNAHADGCQQRTFNIRYR
jgi:hypothetical protein